jgi:DNA primase
VEVKKLKVLKEILGHYRKTGNEYLFSCPFCKHHKPKFSVNLNKGAKCWVCDWSTPSIFRVIKRFGNYSQISLWSSMEETVEITDFSKDMFDTTKTFVKEEVISLPEGFVSLANKNIPKTAAYATNYLRGRGVSTRDIKYWKIGYCPSGEYGGRIIIPSFNNDGRVNYFIARSYGNTWPRYKNPPAQRNTMVFNELYIQWEEPIHLVEGAFDAIKAGPNSIPILGSTLREDSKLFQMIIKHRTPVYIALDKDAEKKSNRIVRSLMQHDIEVYKIAIDDQDVGDMSPSEFKQRKSQAVTTSSDNFILRQAWTF